MRASHSHHRLPVILVLPNTVAYLDRSILTPAEPTAP